MRIVKIHKFFITLFAAIALAITPSISFATLDSTYKFEMNISGVQNFGFKIVATGTFYVDCGDNSANMYGGPGITVTPLGSGKFQIEQTVDAVERTSNSFNHVCVVTSNTSDRTVSIGGSATAFSNNYPSFQVSVNPNGLTSISGDLTAVFPKVGSTYPSFAGAFRGCTKLSWIPASTFYGLSLGNPENSSGNPSVNFTDVFKNTASQKGCPSGYADVAAGYYPGYATAWEDSSHSDKTMHVCAVVYTITLNDGTENGMGVPIPGQTRIGSVKFHESSLGGFFLYPNATGQFQGLAQLPVKSPYTFNGYYTAGGTQIIDSSGTLVNGVSLGADTTIYARWTIDTPFSVTTTNLINSNDEVRFVIGAGGFFYVDCGTDGKLYDMQGDHLSEIIKSHDSTPGQETVYRCVYTSGGTKTIQFGGRATDYATINEKVQSIGFSSGGTRDHIAGLSGTLGAIFPTLSSTQMPSFANTFSGCTELTGNIPPLLFSGVTGGHAHMFDSTFYGCEKLTGTIPSSLFSGVTGGHAHMFDSTFEGCKKLYGELGGNLFNGITMGADYLFYRTFANCENLGRDSVGGARAYGISGDLLRRVSGHADYEFAGMFENCSGFTGIQENLFLGVNGPGAHMFESTFRNCDGLTGLIPAGLFANVTGAANSMFKTTFSRCVGLTGTIPAGLFARVGEIVGGNDTEDFVEMFQGTFAWCTGLTGIIPGGLFANVKGTGDSLYKETFEGCTGITGIGDELFDAVTGSSKSLFEWTFGGCTSLTSIPSGLFTNALRPAGEATFSANTNMFLGTFAQCTSLTSIPNGLFRGLSGLASGMFQQTFAGCSSLRGALPSDLFAGLSGSSSSGGMFYMTFFGCNHLGQEYENGQWVSKYNIPGGIFGNSVTSYHSTMFNLAFYSTSFLDCCVAGTRQMTTADNNVAQFVDNWSGIGADFTETISSTCTGMQQVLGVGCVQGGTRKVACITGTPPAGELTWVDGQCIENCGKTLNVKHNNAAPAKEYFMYKRTGTLVGNKTLNIKESGATDTCYVPFSSTAPATINNNGIQGVLTIKVNGTTYYAEPTN